ncbi:hypothetical protein [Marinobacter alexandrii]|jgi:protein CpxP|uniref:hypothetical protein n=1 Tax=Marinobacter alexandrii TaxID=2570351 RepID=UPI002ABD9A6C|nr:hypothetical protein [Marinobacter alexandrii]
MRNSKTKLTITAIFLAGTIGTFSALAHEGEGKGMMSSEGMKGMSGMMGMMNMMSDMSPEDRKAMTEACMKMMQSHGSGGMEDNSTDAK